MIAILADDLTSALDGAAPFAGRGLSVRVVLHEAGLSADVDVVSLDLDTRFTWPAEAEQRFMQAARQVADASIIYKTVDSTLRGNLGPEVNGTLLGSGRKRAVVAPAFPAAGRTTIGGRQFLDRVALEHTAFARDLRTPTRTSKVADHLRCIDSSRFMIHDAEEDRALDDLVREITLDADVVWVGSPGLGSALARALPYKQAGLPPRWRHAWRVLVVIGSLHPANVEQAEHLRRSGAALVEMDAFNTSLQPEPMASRLRAAFTKANVVCLISPRTLAKLGPNVSAQPAEQLAAIVREVSAEFDGLIVTGGDTARRIVDALHATAIDLAGEVEPGVPFGALRIPGRNLAFVTKAGGFGSADTFQRCVLQLRSSVSPS